MDTSRGQKAARPSGDDRAREVRRVVAIILVLNLAVAATKAIYGWLSGSLAVASDAVHSALDAASNVIGLLVLRLAQSPPDRGHPYGHQKIEIVAAAGIGLLIGAAALRFGWAAVQALLGGARPTPAGAGGFAALMATLAVNVFVATYEARRGRALQSSFLTADAAHTFSDVFVTLGVLGSLLAVRLGVPWADPAFALLILLIILRVAWKLLVENLGVLIDRAALDEEQVCREVLRISGVVSCHRIRSRGAAGTVHLDLHVLVDGDLPLREAHEIAHAVEARLKDALPGVVDVDVHVEPSDDPEEGL